MIRILRSAGREKLIGMGIAALLGAAAPARAQKATADLAPEAQLETAPTAALPPEPPPPAEGVEVAEDMPPALQARDTYPPCEDAPTESGTAAAKGAFHAGTAAFNEADYERAIVYWEDAFRRDCTAVAMLKNLARAYELNDQYQKAIDALTTYAARANQPSEGDALARRVQNLERKQAEERARRDASRAPQDGPKTPGQGDLAGSSTPGWDAEIDDSTQPARSFVPLVFAGIGLGAGVLGLVQWQSAEADRRRIERQCPNSDCGQNTQLAADGNNARSRIQLWGWGVTGGGSALLVGGVVWYFLQSPEPNAPLALELGPRYAGARLRGTF